MPFEGPVGKADPVIVEEIAKRVSALHPEASTEDVLMAAQALAIAHPEIMDEAQVEGLPADEVEALYKRRLENKPGPRPQFAVDSSGVATEVKGNELPEDTQSVV